VLIEGFAAPAFATNCWVLAADGSDECLVVDPGIDQPDIRGMLDGLLSRLGLRPVAVLATHGHLDHTFSIRPVCEERGIPAYIHAADAAALADPWLLAGPGLRSMFAGLEWIAPSDIRTLSDGASVEIAGLSLVVDHAPGHTPGSVLFRFADDGVVVTGDVLFAGSIGRTDLPGGSMEAMATSLVTKIAVLDDGFQVLPGHGPRTEIGRERMTNPYLQAAIEGRLA
jgi:glyoxylase-like metal-dependent hydrolase (beta-lactamase superfamily II)